MPVKKTARGYKYGTSGKEYTGKDARVLAEKQGEAIQASKARRGK